MEQKINLILSSIQGFCRKGYLEPKEREVLYDLADLHEIDRKVIDEYVSQELEKAKKAKYDWLIRISKQPDAAISDMPLFYPQSRRQFPDVVKVGLLALKMNPQVTSPLFVPIADTDNFCIKYADSSEDACNLLQNITVRILLSLPRSLTRITILDPENMGNQLLSLSSIDRDVLKVIGETSGVTTFLQNLSRDINTFNFNELGNKFASIADYNRTNRSKARPYNLILIPDFPRVIQKDQIMALNQIMKLAHKIGVFFITTASAVDLESNPNVENVFKTNQCLIDMSTSKPVICSFEPMQIINNGFDIVLKKEIEFTDDTLYGINHELKPDAYPDVIIPDGKDSIESICLSVGKNKQNEKPVNILLQGENDNLLIVSDDSQEVADLTNCAVYHAIMDYKLGEVKFAFCNYDTIPAEVCGDNLMVNIKSSKTTYMKGLFDHLTSIVEERKQIFGEDNYVGYRRNTDEVIPRIVVVISSIDSLLGSEDIEAVEIIMQLDQLLGNAGRYGIHFILAGQPSNDFFKINLGGNVQFKILSKITALDASMLGIFLNEGDLRMLEDSASAMLVLSEEGKNINFNIKPLDSVMVNKMVERIGEHIGDAKYDAPYLFFDQDDNYPACYALINANNVSDKVLKESFPIGFMRAYTNSFCSLKVGDIFTMVMGDDQEAVLSIMKSLHTALLCQGIANGLSVFDAQGSNPIGIAGLPGVSLYDKLDYTPIKENGAVCLMNMESYDYNDLQPLESFLNRAHNAHAKVLFFSKKDVVSEGKVPVSLFDAKEKIALMQAPENFISQIHFVSDELLSLPQTAYGAILEQEADNYVTKANALWLFKY